MRLQDRLDHHDAIPRTLTLLSARMAEIGEQPTPQALTLAARLQHRPESTTSPIRQQHAGNHRGTAAAK